MSKKITLTLDEKIGELRDAGWYIEKRNGGYIYFHEKKNANNPYWVNHSSNDPKLELVSERAIHHLYRVVFKKGTGYKKVIKKLSSGKDRAAQRSMRAKDDFENAPSQNRIKEENTLGWGM